MHLVDKEKIHALVFWKYGRLLVKLGEPGVGERLKSAGLRAKFAVLVPDRKIRLNGFPFRNYSIY
jgi:hypothetical protein